MWELIFVAQMSTRDLVILFQPARRRSRRRQNCAFASRRFLNSGESTAQWQDVRSKTSDIWFKIYKYCTFRVRSIKIEYLLLYKSPSFFINPKNPKFRISLSPLWSSKSRVSAPKAVQWIPTSGWFEDKDFQTDFLVPHSAISNVHISEFLQVIMHHHMTLERDSRQGRTNVDSQLLTKHQSSNEKCGHFAISLKVSICHTNSTPESWPWLSG